MKSIRYTFLSCLLFIVAISISAQRHSYLTNGPIQEDIPFITAETFSFYIVPLRQDGFPDGVKIRWKDGQGNTSEWQEFHQDEHADRGRYVSQLSFANKREWVGFELEMPQSGPINLYFFDPGITENTNTGSEGEALEPALCFQPEVQLRNDWCPAGNCPKDNTPSITTVTHLIVHHSAGVNQANDWAAIVRTIWDFHVNGNGWDDIGYNYLVDPNGVVYEGRGNNVRGAHFCGNNTNTMGFCMLGNFTTQVPTLAARESLSKMLAWKCQQNDIDPLAASFHAPSNLNLNNLSGHREGCNTVCPGQAFFDLFGTFRQAVATELADCETSSVTDLEPEWGRNVKIFPNPGSGPVRITGLPNQANLQLYTATGELIIQSSADKVTNVEAMLESAAAGTYLLRVEANESAIMRKLVRVQ